jgi:membrane protein
MRTAAGRLRARRRFSRNTIFGLPVDRIFSKFFADRGTHLAAMIAYFALLSFVPLLFLALAVLGLVGRAGESSFLVTELKRTLPESSVSSIVGVVRAIQRNAATLGVVGGFFLIWSSLSLFSVLESAFNVVYDRPNRAFLHGKVLALSFMLASLVTLFVGLLAGSIGYDLLHRHAPGFIGNGYVAYVLSVIVSSLALFLFLFSAYLRLTNVRQTPRDVLPGALIATAALEVTFQVLPVYLRLSAHVPALQALGGPAILLVWLYVMANVIVFGAEVNWWASQSRRSGGADDVPGLA